MQIKDKCFLISGGGAGLGAATARLIVQEGGQVLIADVNREAGTALAQELGARAHFIATDVSNEASAQAAVDAAVKVFGGLHGLVNCAGVAPAKKVLGKEGPHGFDDF